MIAEHENPAAHLYRALGREIVARDDEARFYEQRGNRWLRNMLITRGAKPFLTFQNNFPEIDYVTYDDRHGQELADWLNLVLATVDIALVDAAAPLQIVKWTAELTRPHLHTFLIEPESLAERDELSEEAVRMFRGLCLSEPDATRFSGFESHQYVISLGPSTFDAGANGNAARYLESTAGSLVDRMVRAVDETLLDLERDDTQHESSPE